MQPAALPGAGEISDITANTMTINNDLEGELEKLNVTSMEYNKDLNALDDDLNKISERLDAVQTPLGSLPVGLKEAIPVFPILLTTSFLVCGYFLLRTGGLSWVTITLKITLPRWCFLCG